MTVLRMNPTEEYAAPRRGNTFADSGRRGAWSYPASGQVQNWARGMELSSGRRRGVINEKKSSLPAFSSEGIRWDVLTVALALVLLLLTGILAADVGALFAGGDRIGKLSDRIESLELMKEQVLKPSSLEKEEKLLSLLNDVSIRIPVFL